MLNGSKRAGPRANKPSALLRILPKLLLSLVLGGMLAWVAERGGVPIVPSADSFRTVRWELVAVSALLLFVLTFVRATRFRFLIAPVKKLPLREIVLVNWAGFFAIFALPLRLGEFVRPSLSKLRSGIPVSVGLGTVAVERVFDGTITSLCVAWSLWALPRLPTDDAVARVVPYYTGAVLTVFGCALLALFAFLWQRDLAVRLTQRVFALISPKLGEVLAAKVDGVASGLRSLGSLRLTLSFLGESLLYWGINACFMWVLGIACGLPMTLGHATAVMGVLALGILLPSGPGLFGSFQVAVSAALKLYFPVAMVSREGAVFVFLLYGLNAAMMVAVGVLPLLRMDVSLGELLTPPADAKPATTSKPAPTSERG